jgi:hypothetical protein
MSSLFLRVLLDEAAVFKRKLIKKGVVIADDGWQQEREGNRGTSGT